MSDAALAEQTENLETVAAATEEGIYKQLEGSMVVDSIIDRVVLENGQIAVRANVTDRVREAILDEQDQWVERVAQAQRIANLLIEKDESGQLTVVDIVFDEVLPE